MSAKRKDRPRPPDAVLRDLVTVSKLSASARAIIKTIASYASARRPWCTPALAELEAATGYVRLTVRRGIEEAEAQGWLEVSRAATKGARANRYRVTPPAWAVAADEARRATKTRERKQKARNNAHYVPPEEEPREEEEGQDEGDRAGELPAGPWVGAEDCA